MISDVLHEAVEDLDRYLTSSNFENMYKGKDRSEIIKLRDEALYIARKLDMRPGAPVPTKKDAIAKIAEERHQMPRSSS